MKEICDGCKKQNDDLGGAPASIGALVMKQKEKRNWLRRWKIEKLLLRSLRQKAYSASRKAVEQFGGLKFG